MTITQDSIPAQIQPVRTSVLPWSVPTRAAFHLSGTEPARPTSTSVPRYSRHMTGERHQLESYLDKVPDFFIQTETDRFSPAFFAEQPDPESGKIVFAHERSSGQPHVFIFSFWFTCQNTCDTALTVSVCSKYEYLYNFPRALNRA